MLNDKLDKADLKSRALRKLFDKRIDKAREEYRKSVEGTIHEFQMVSYRNNLFNPLQLKPHQLQGVYSIEEDSEHGKALNRLIRCLDELQEATGYLTYFLNFVESSGEFTFIVFGEGRVSATREEAVTTFIKASEDKLTIIKRLRLLAEIV